MSWVWDNSPHSGGALVVLLAIADFAHEDGSGAFPSVETLAAKARLSKRQTQTILKELATSGELLVARGGGRRKSNTYTIVMETSAARQPVHTSHQLHQPRSAKKDAVSAPFYTKGEIYDSAEGRMLYENSETDSAETVQPSSPEPLREPSLETLEVEPLESSTWLCFNDEKDWHEKILAAPGMKHQVAVLVEMVDAHEGPPHESGMGGRAAALLRGAKDPSRAVSLVWASLNASRRTGDVMRYALGILKGSHENNVRTGGGPFAETMSAHDFVASGRYGRHVL